MTEGSADPATSSVAITKFADINLTEESLAKPGKTCSRQVDFQRDYVDSGRFPHGKGVAMYGVSSDEIVAVRVM